MNKDGLNAELIRAGNDNIFQSKVFTTTFSSLTGKPVEIFNTTGALELRGRQVLILVYGRVKHLHR